MVAVGGDYVIIGYFMGRLIAGPFFISTKQHYRYDLMLRIMTDPFGSVDLPLYLRSQPHKGGFPMYDIIVKVAATVIICAYLITYPILMVFGFNILMSHLGLGLTIPSNLLIWAIILILEPTGMLNDHIETLNKIWHL
jgi:hypothetical protein